MEIKNHCIEFALNSSQSVSNSLKKVITFKEVQQDTMPFDQALSRFRENSLFSVLKSKKRSAILVLDKSILPSWTSQSLDTINQKFFKMLVDSTTELRTQAKSLLLNLTEENFEEVRNEIHPNFLAVMPANQKVFLLEFNVHIERNSGKLWLLVEL